MGLHTAFTALAEIIDAYESRGRVIQTVEASPADTGVAVLNVTVAMPVSLCSVGGADDGLTPETARLTDSGDLEATFSPSATDLPSTPDAALSVGDAAATVTDDGLILTVQLTIDATTTPDEVTDTDCEPGQADTDESAAVDAVTPADTNGSASLDAPAGSNSEASLPEADASRAPTQSGGAATEKGRSNDDSSTESDPCAVVRDNSVPPYEDTDYLQALYDRCDNFREIAEQIQMDVSSETVRRYMIEADIHVPNTYNTTGDEGETSSNTEEPGDTSDQTAAETGDGQVSVAESDPAEADSSAEGSVSELPDEQLVADGLGLPTNVRLRDVADAVVDSDTVYEVQQHLSLDRSRTRSLLEELNLLDLVLCRLTSEPENSVSYGEIADRIRQCTPRNV